MNVKKSFLNLVKDEQGAELAEYAVAVALLVAIAVIVYQLLGKAINDSNSGTAARVGTNPLTVMARIVCPSISFVVS